MNLSTTLLYVGLGLALLWLAAAIVFESYFYARKKYIEEVSDLLTRDFHRGKDRKEIPVSTEGRFVSKG